MRNNTVKAALRAGKAQVGTWLSLGSPLAARFMAQAGFDWLNVDIEHTATSWEQAALMFGAIADAGGVPLARVPSTVWRTPSGRWIMALSASSFRCAVPWRRRNAVSACKYPPVGERSVGGNLHALNFQCSPADYYAHANDEILVIVQAEHVARCRERGRDTFRPRNRRRFRRAERPALLDA